MRPSWTGSLVVVVLLALVTTALVSRPWVVGPLLLGLAVLVAINALQKWRLVHRRGYLVVRDGRDAFCYQEVHHGRTRELTIDGELMARGPHLIYIPSDSDWRATVPDWARDRKGEIVARVKRDLGDKHFRFVEE